MIEISVTDSSVSITGHAGYAEPGQDIVCAGISALGQTLLLSLEELTEDHYNAIAGNGNLYIKFSTLSDRAKTLKECFFIGCKAIAESYPDYVRIVGVE